MDADHSRERSDTLQGLFTSGGWIVVANQVAADRNQLQATYHTCGVLPGTAQSCATRIDFLVCNRCAWAHFTSFRSRLDLKIPCHVVTDLVLLTQPFSPMCTVWVPPREYHLNEKGLALQNLKQTGAKLWKTLLNNSRPTCVNMLRTRTSSLPGTPGYKLLRSAWVVPRSSEPSSHRLDGSQGAVVLQFVRQQKVSAPGRRAILTDGASSRTLSRWQQVLDVVTEMWQQSRRHAQKLDSHL